MEMKPIFLVIVICGFIAISSIAVYFNVENDPNGNNTAEFTAIESLNYTKAYMQNESLNYKLSSLYYSNNSQWVQTFIITDTANITYVELKVWANGSFTHGAISTYSLLEIDEWYYPWDSEGFDISDLNIDSDVAEDIIRNFINNETNFDTNNDLRLRLETSISHSTPIWVGILDSSPNFRVKVSGISGEIIDSYIAFTPDTFSNLVDDDNILNGSSFTALSGFSFAQRHIESSYNYNYTISEIISGNIINDNLGKSTYWTYTFVMVDESNNKLIHETVTVYSNKTEKYSNTIYEMHDLHMNVLHGFFDMEGYNPDVIQTDSDEAHAVIFSQAKNESWYDSSSPFSMILYGRINNSINPIWKGQYYTSDGLFAIEVNAETGEIIEA